MQILAFDTETAKIRPALLAPPLVCVTWARPGLEARIEAAGNAKHLLCDWLRDPNTLLVGHNVAYDMAVVGEAFPDLIADIFNAYENNRVTDTMIRQQLLDIAAGIYRGYPDKQGKWIVHEYTLDALARRCAGIRLKKDAWRTSYGEFLGLPLDKWPECAREVQKKARARLDVIERIEGFFDDAALKKEWVDLLSMVEGDPNRCTEYPLDDARATLAVYEAQEKHAAYLKDQFRQTRAAFALHLSSAWGLRTDAHGVDILTRETQAQVEELTAELLQAGLVREDGSRDTKAAAARMVEVCKRDNRKLRRTASHKNDCTADDCHVSLDADACNATEDEILMAYAELSTAKKVLTNDCVALAGGTQWPLHPRYNLAETGRTTCSKPNVQNLRRRAGIREAFIPRSGHVFAQADYPQLELFCLAQCCVSYFGHSKLADALNAGLDPHAQVAANILGKTYDYVVTNLENSEVDNARQTAKVANFGYPGGLGLEKLVLFARKAYKVSLTPAKAKELKETWFATYPEMRAYFARVNSLCQDGESAVVETLFTERYRGGASYCAACNNGFQALGSDCAKLAMWLVAKAQYTQPESPLWNTRTVFFVHDELGLEVNRDLDRANSAARELARLMCKAANRYLPDVPIPLSKITPCLMERWSKKAKAVYDAKGRLVPWAP